MHSGYPLVAKLSDLERMTLPPPPSLNESVSSMARGGEIRGVRKSQYRLIDYLVVRLIGSDPRR